MALGYSDKVVQRYYVAATVSQYDVVKLHTTAGQIALAGASNKPLGIAMEAGNVGEYIDVCVEGEYFAVAAEELAVGDDLSCAASGEIRTAYSLDTHTLGVLGPKQAAAVTNDLVAVKIQKSVISIA